MVRNKKEQKTFSKEKKNYEIILPTPYVLDSSISDTDLIDELNSAQDDKSVAAIFSSALQVPTSSFVISASEEDLFQLFNFESDDYNSFLDEDDGIYIISILNKKGEYLGRGEISEIGKKITASQVKTIMRKHMKEFLINYRQGENRLGSLIYKLKQKESAIPETTQMSISPVGFNKKILN